MVSTEGSLLGLLWVSRKHLQCLERYGVEGILQILWLEAMNDAKVRISTFQPQLFISVEPDKLKQKSHTHTRLVVSRAW